MRQLRRETPDTKTADIEARVSALERRFIGIGHAWAQVTRNTDTAVTASGAYSVQWETFLTNAPLTFWTNTDNSMTKHNTSGDTSLVCAEYGVYIALSSSEWEYLAGGYAHRQITSAGRQRGLGTGTFGASVPNAVQTEYTTAAAANQILDVTDTNIGVHERWDYSTTQPANWTMQAVNDSGSNRNLLRASICVVLLPNGERLQDFTVY